MWFNAYLIYCLIICVIFIISIPYYIWKNKSKHERKEQMDRPTRKKENQGSASTVCHPARLVLVLFLQVVR